MDAQGLVGTVTQNYSETIAAGSVISQAPNVYTVVGIGALTSINVSKGSEYVTVPDMTGIDILDADDTLGLLGLVSYYTGQSHETLLLGQVISQSPEPGLSVLIGSTVAVVVSTGKSFSVMPDVIDLTQAAATAAITGVGLVASISTAWDTVVPVGDVIRQFPDAGVILQVDSEVSIVVSTGANSIVVPTVVGEIKEAAQAIIETKNLTFTFTESYSTGIGYNTIISQSIPAGTHVSEGTILSVEVSLGATPSTIDYTPAEILVEYYIGQGIFDRIAPKVEWPVYVSHLPGGKEQQQASAFTDSEPFSDGRLMFGTHIEHGSVQCRVRARDFNTAKQKMAEVVNKAELIKRTIVTMPDGQVFRLDNVSRSSGVLPMGVEPETRLFLYSVNFVTTIKRATE
jgi:beta-lactam-binding protein with PASTA domain